MGSRGQVSGRLVALERGYDWMELHGDEALGGLGAKVNTAWGLHGGGGGAVLPDGAQVLNARAGRLRPAVRRNCVCEEPSRRPVCT